MIWKTHANLYTLATKIIDINCVVINSLLNKPFIVKKNWTVFLYNLSNNFDDLIKTIYIELKRFN